MVSQFHVKPNPFVYPSDQLKTKRSGHHRLIFKHMQDQIFKDIQDISRLRMAIKGSLIITHIWGSSLLHKATKQMVTKKSRQVHGCNWRVENSRMLGKVKRAEGANPPADYAEGVGDGPGVLKFLKPRKNISHDGSIHKMASERTLIWATQGLPNIEELPKT